MVPSLRLKLRTDFYAGRSLQPLYTAGESLKAGISSSDVCAQARSSIRVRVAPGHAENDDKALIRINLTESAKTPTRRRSVRVVPFRNLMSLM
jgi:hypothetical protein